MTQSLAVMVMTPSTPHKRLHQTNAGGGDDLIIGGDGAGDDSYDGGTGVDTIKYTSATDDIVVDLAKVDCWL